MSSDVEKNKPKSVILHEKIVLVEKGKPLSVAVTAVETFVNECATKEGHPTFNRQIEQSFKQLLLALDIPISRYTFLGKSAFSTINLDLNVMSPRSGFIYSQKHPMLVMDNENNVVRTLCFSPQGRISEHRFIGFIYGYPLCCIDSYVKRLKYFKQNDNDNLRKDYLERAGRRQSFVKLIPYGFEPCGACQGNERELGLLIKKYKQINDEDLNSSAVWMQTVTRYIKDELLVWMPERKKTTDTECIV